MTTAHPCHVWAHAGFALRPNISKFPCPFIIISSVPRCSSERRQCPAGSRPLSISRVDLLAKRPAQENCSAVARRRCVALMSESSITRKNSKRSRKDRFDSLPANSAQDAPVTGRGQRVRLHRALLQSETPALDDWLLALWSSSGRRD
jgi:hypothetical protein